MSTLLPNRSVEDHRPSPAFVSIGESDSIFDALASETAREILSMLHEDPATMSEVAERIDTTVQNVSYHVKRLESAGLVSPVDTWYSTKGREMEVFGATSQPLVLFTEEADFDGERTVTEEIEILKD